jgi:hypothetical protein
MRCLTRSGPFTHMIGGMCVSRCYLSNKAARRPRSRPNLFFTPPSPPCPGPMEASTIHHRGSKPDSRTGPTLRFQRPGVNQKNLTLAPVGINSRSYLFPNTRTNVKMRMCRNEGGKTINSNNCPLGVPLMRTWGSIYRVSYMQLLQCP